MAPMPYISVPPERLNWITERIRTGKWNSRSEVINNINRNFNKILRRAGVAKCTVHDLRRSALTNWAQKPPFHVVHKLAGHSSIKTTMEYYLAVRPEDFKLAGEALKYIIEKSRQD